MVTLIRADNGRSIAMRPGETIVLRLDENPTTGFRWAVEQGDDEILPLQRSDFVQEPGAAVGGGGQRILTFEATRNGNVRLLLRLRRAWEGEGSATGRFEVCVRVGS